MHSHRAIHWGNSGTSRSNCPLSALLLLPPWLPLLSSLLLLHPPHHLPPLLMPLLPLLLLPPHPLTGEMQQKQIATSGEFRCLSRLVTRCA